MKMWHKRVKALLQKPIKSSAAPFSFQLERLHKLLFLFVFPSGSHETLVCQLLPRRVWMPVCTRVNAPTLWHMQPMQPISNMLIFAVCCPLYFYLVKKKWPLRPRIGWQFLKKVNCYCPAPLIKSPWSPTSQRVDTVNESSLSLTGIPLKAQRKEWKRYLKPVMKQHRLQLLK